MDREELLGIRKKVHDAYTDRKKLGDFDANSEVIRLCLASLIEVITHLLEEMKKQQRKCSPKD